MNCCPKSKSCKSKLKGAHCELHKESYLCKETVGRCPVCVKVKP